MKSNGPVGRRSILTGVGTVGILYLHGGARAKRAASKPDRSSASRENSPVAAEERFTATVDRIVDSNHVVLLVADHGEVVAQYDVARTALPTVQEGDQVLVTVTDGTLTAVRTESGTRRAVGEVQPTATAW